MSISICWRPAADAGRRFKLGTSLEYDLLQQQFGSVIERRDVPMLRAMAKAAQSKFYDEVADTIEMAGAISFWANY